VACGVLGVIVLFNVEIPKLGANPVRIALAIGVGLLAGYLMRKENADRQGYHLFARNFYGELRIRDDDVGQEYALRNLLHGTINHGSQRLNPEHRYEVNSYYAPSSGIGRTMGAKQALGPVRYGVIGMGAGVMTDTAVPVIRARLRNQSAGKVALRTRRVYILRPLRRR